MVDANDLILFVRVVDAGSFSQAAERAHLPKSTLSRRLTLLEEALGEKLFVRSTRRVAITAFGERILEHARRLVDETEEVAALAQHRQETPHGDLRVSMPPDLIEFDFVAFCQAFQARYPAVRLRIDLSPRRVDLLSERFDVAVRAAQHLPDDTTLVARKLFDVGQGLFACPDYLAEHGTPATPDDLVEHACLAYAGHDGTTLPWVLARGDARWEQVVQGPLVCNSPRLQREMAYRGAGIAALPVDAALRDWIGNGRLRRVLPDWSLPTASLWCVMPGRRLMPARTRVFVDMLKAHMDAVMSG